MMTLGWRVLKPRTDTSGADSEEGALTAIEGMRVRYVVVRASENQKRRDRFPRAMQTRLEKYRGSERWMVAKGTHQDPMHFQPSSTID